MAKRPYRAFRFKQFQIQDDHCAMKVGTDGVLVGAWADVSSARNILDIGTGSGVIAIMQAQKNQNAQIIGIEIDAAAAKQAKGNAFDSPWNERIEIKQLPLQEYLPESSFDHIISNPPFFENNNFVEDLQRQQARQITTLTFQNIIDFTSRYLSEEGKLSLILPRKEAQVFIGLAKINQLFINRLLEVKPKKDKAVERICMELSRHENNHYQKENIIIQHEARNDWTEDYIQLTGTFYLKM